MRIVILGRGIVGLAIGSAAREAGNSVKFLAKGDVDLTSANAYEELEREFELADVVVGTSALAPVKNVEMFADNMKIVANIFAGFQRSSAKPYFLNISSDAVYGDSDIPLTEESPKSVDSLHGLMHITRERIFDELPNQVGHLRSTLVYGIHDRHKGYGPNLFLRTLRDSSGLTTYGYGEELRDHIFANDLGQIALEVIKAKWEGPVNCASGNLMSFDSIAKLAKSVAHYRGEIERKPRVGAMPHNGYRPIDVTLMRSICPEYTMTDMGVALEQMWKEMKHGGS